MGLNRNEKSAVIEEVVAQRASGSSVIVAEDRGLEVGAITVLRKRARENGVYLRVLKNTLARRAIAGTPFEGLTGSLVGPLIYGISSDPVAPAKVLNDFAKGNDKLVLKSGCLPNVKLSAADVQALAMMPSREELLARLLGTLQAPATKFVRTLNEVPGKFVRALAAVQRQKEEAGA
jgi:large subunit ribosomal protein L10